MKRAIISSMTLCFALLAWAEDDNTFYFTDAAVQPGETTNIELCLRNSATDLTCLEAEIQLPEGLSVVCDEEGNPAIKLYRNRTKEHELLANVLEGGNLKLLVSSLEGKLVSGEDGPLLSFQVKALNTAPTGEYAVQTVGESLLVTTEAEAYPSVGATGNVLITDDQTAIDEIKNEDLRMKNEDAIYDLSGRKMVNGKLKKGILIKGGRKELHK